MAMSHRVAEGMAGSALRSSVLALAILGFGVGGAANAQTPSPRAAPSFPTKPVRMIVPFPPGGATDVIARMLSQKLIEIWGHPVVLDYKPGAGTVVGTDAVAKSAADGYTTGMVITAHVINPSLRSDLPFDTLKDLSGVSLVAVSHIVLVATPSLEANSVAELIDLAKRNPGKLAYATPGTGTAMHLAGEMLRTLAGIDIVHVPYKGGAPAYPDVISGRVPLQFDPMFASMANIKSGKVKALAITSPTRARNAPEIPTVAETVPGFSVVSISGVVVPSATPRDIVGKLSADINRALQTPDLAERMGQVGMEPAGTTPEQFDALIRAEIEKWAKVVKASGAKLD
jgi:tripartite-type tricarboxylate transporter receptor subunit TctC